MAVPKPAQNGPSPVDGEIVNPDKTLLNIPRAEAIELAPRSPVRARARQVDPKKFQHYFGSGAMTRLTLELDVPPEEQQNVLRRYAKEVVESVLPTIQCPENTGFLLNLDWPSDVLNLRIQLRDLIENLESARDLQNLEDEDFEAYGELILKLRKEVVRLVEEELEGRGLERKVGVLGKKYGQGNMGAVFSCRLGYSDVAAKMKRRQEDIENNLTYHEYPELIEATQSSENLVRYRGSLELEDDSYDRLDFFEELKGAVPLDDHLGLDWLSNEKRLKDLKSFLFDYFLPTLQGVKALHDRHLVHCDIKEANILVIPSERQPEVKLGDYDLLRRSGFRPKGDYVQGTLSYMSPEQLNAGTLTEKSDIYSLGMILYYRLGGEHPETQFEYFKRAMDKIPMEGLNCPDSMKELMSKCLNINPADRPNIDELIEGLGSLLSDPGFEAEIRSLSEGKPKIMSEEPEEMRLAA
jgi:hypothetical protein